MGREKLVELDTLADLIEKLVDGGPRAWWIVLRKNIKNQIAEMDHEDGGIAHGR